jgi:hypothetical protein
MQWNKCERLLTVAVWVKNTVFKLVLMLGVTAISVNVQSEDDFFAAITGHGESVIPQAQTNISPTSLVQTDFTVRPSVTSSRLGASVETIPLTATCTDSSGQPVAGCNFVLSLERIPFTGGHDHDSANRPVGSFSPPSGLTDANGKLETIYTAPEISGIVKATVSGTSPNGGPTMPGSATIGVQINGLAPLGSNVNYDLIGMTVSHSDNHYGLQGFNSCLRTLAKRYAATYPGSKLAYNDMSLINGGLFDISGAWSRPHGSHRFGNDGDLDISSVPVTRRSLLRGLAKNAGMSTILVYGTHWHLRQ